MAWFGKKDKDELSKKRDAKKKLPYKRCGHKRTYFTKEGSKITVICTKNANDHRGGHD